MLIAWMDMAPDFQKVLRAEPVRYLPRPGLFDLGSEGRRFFQIATAYLCEVEKLDPLVEPLLR